MARLRGAVVKEAPWLRRGLGWVGGGVLLVVGAFVGLAVSAAALGLSLPAQALRLLAPLLLSDSPSDPALYRQQLLKQQAAGPALPSAAFRRRYTVTESRLAGQRIFRVAPKSAVMPRRAVLYLHGGAYVSDLTPPYWDLVGRLAEGSSAAVVVPVYPLAPTHDWRAAHAMILTIYEQLASEVGTEHLVIAGDSAGGGFALAATQQLRDQGRPLPAALVLFSPWLDATLDDPRQPALDRRDPILSIHAVRQAGRWWAGELPVTDPRISPLFGSLAGLPPTLVFTGTDDLLYPDALRLQAQAQAAGLPLTLITVPHELHAWVVLFPNLVPEARRALDRAADFIVKATS